MKFPLSALVLATAFVEGFVLNSHVSPIASSATLCRAGSCASAFARTHGTSHSRSSTRRGYSRGDMLMYEPGSDPPNEKPRTATGSDEVGVWSALANTERWITETFQNANSGNASPYARKELSYVCETTNNLAAVVGSTFRRLRNVRELGEAHGQEEERRIAQRGPEYVPRTLRQTHVVVMPWSEDLNSSFHIFDSVMQAINRARRNARDYVTDISLEKLDERMIGEGERDWVVSVNCAHMHPRYGEKTPEEILAEMEQEEAKGEVDLNIEAYKEMRLKARRSPYPTLAIEVMASPPPDFQEHAMPPPSTQGQSRKDDKVSSVDIQRLEALFGNSAALEHPTHEEDLDGDEDDDDFYAAIGKAAGIEEISFVTPMNLARKWVAGNDPMYNETSSTFSVSAETMHVDAGYEFVFSNIGLDYAMMTPPVKGAQEFTVGKRKYLAMPNFLTSSATSFEKFSGEVSNIINAIPGLSGSLEVSTLHPEHVDKERRSPVPIFVLQWYEGKAPQ